MGWFSNKRKKEQLEAGADVNEANNDGNTPLSVASVLGHAEVAKLLLEAGADVNKDDNDINLMIKRLNTEDYIDRIDAIMDVSSNDDEEIVNKLIDIAIDAERGEVRVAAAVGLCEHRSNKKIELLEKRLSELSESEGRMLSGGDPKATIALILAVMNDSYNLTHVLEKHPAVKSAVLEYLGKADRDYEEINSGIDQIAYLLAWCATIDMGYGDKRFIEYVGHKTKSSKKLVSSIIEWM